MQTVGTKSKILLASDELQRRLAIMGEFVPVSKTEVLFKTGDANNGVFLVGSGRIKLRVNDMPRFDRSFPTGSLLGLPSTFTGHPYSLTAVSEKDSEVVRVPREAFLDLMRQEPSLCQEANAMLCREVAFIHSALAQRKQQIAS